jgi:large subunit ribosomal protein L21
MYAVVTTGGKQYRVEAGSELTIERLSADAGSSVTFDRVLMVGDGDTITVGTPTVAGATVSGTILGESLGPRLVIFKFKQKVKYRRTSGHRQHFTRVRIDEISASGKTSKAETPAAAKADKPEKAAATKAAPAKKAAAAKAGTADKPKRATRATKPKATAAARKPKAAAADEKPKRTRKPAAPKAESEE